MMKWSKTTLAGIVKILVIALGMFGVVVSPEQAEKITVGGMAVWAVVDIIQAKLTKDA